VAGQWLLLQPLRRAAKGSELSSKNENHKVYYHKVGTPQSEDTLIYQDPANPQRFHNLSTTEDERFAILNISERGKGKKGNALFFMDASRATRSSARSSRKSEMTAMVSSTTSATSSCLETDRKAPNTRVILFDPKAPEEKNWKDILPERPEPLQNAGTAGGKLFATYLKDVSTRAYVYSLDGKLENEIRLPGLGSAGGFGGLNDDKVVFYSFTSFNYPPTIFRLRHREQAFDAFPQSRDSGLQARRLRDKAGLLQQ
jgi:prolyl oligopeptidase